MAKLRDAIGDSGLFIDGDWILSENMDGSGDIGVIQLKHVGIGQFLDKSFQYITKKTFSDLGCTEVLPGDILISRMADPIARACIVPQLPFRTVTAVDVSIVRVDPKVSDGRYISYLCNSSLVRTKAEQIARGTTRSRITRTELEEMEVPFPSIDEQRKISDRLVEADRLRCMRRYALEMSESFLPAVFIEMFGDPARNSKNLPLKEVGELTSLVSSGSTPLGGSSVYLKKGIMFIRSQNVLMTTLDLSDVVFISEETHEHMDRTHVKKGDVLFNITGASIGRVASFDLDCAANVNQHVCIIRSDANKIIPKFLAYQLSIPSFQSKILANEAGATRQAFTFDQIKQFKVIVPSMDIQKKYIEIVHEHEHLQRIRQESIRQSEHLFQSLLNLAFCYK